jgi:hypothetical protein
MQNAVLIGPFADRAGFEAFVAKTQLDPGYGAKVKTTLAQAARAEATMKQLAGDKRYPEVREAAQRFHDLPAQAYLVAHRPRPAEFRGG